VLKAISIILSLMSDPIMWFGLVLRPRKSLEAEILFLRRQLALYVERGVRPRRIDAATRVSLARLSRLFDWRSALVVVRPETLVRWQRAGFRLLWRWKSRAGRRPIPVELRELIRRMARENPLWGQERIANELWVKLGLQVSPRTVRKYLPKPRSGYPRGDQRWTTFLANHAQAILGVRLLRHGDLQLPAAVRVRGDGAPQPTADSLQRDRPSERAVDSPAAT
jgi:putative transposase